MQALKFLVFVSLYTCSLCVLELSRDGKGKSIWKQGNYRNRNVVPRPEQYITKKHRRDIDEQDDSTQRNDIDDDLDEPSTNSKKSNIFRKHFSIPIGAMLPFGYSGVINGDKGSTKKSQVPRGSFADQLSSDPSDHFGVVNALGRSGDASIRSNVPFSTWGLAQKAEKKGVHDENGSERSSILGGSVITDEDLNGQMMEGLSGERSRSERMEILTPALNNRHLVKRNTMASGPTTQEANFRKRLRRYLYDPYYHYHYHHHHHHGGPVIHHHHHHYPRPPPPPPPRPRPYYLPPGHLHVHIHPTPAAPPEPTAAPSAPPTAPPTTPATPPPTIAPPPPPTTTAPPPPAPDAVAPPADAPPADAGGGDAAAPAPAKFSNANYRKLSTSRMLKKDEIRGIPENATTTKHFKDNRTEVTIKKMPLKASDVNHTLGESRETASLIKWKGTFDLKQDKSVKNPQYNNGDYEMLNNYGDEPDGEFDQDFPHSPNGEPSQYQNHDFHHNVQEQHPHAPYQMHGPHDDYKNDHPGHPNEAPMKSVVKDLDVEYKLPSSLNLTNIRSINKRGYIPTGPPASKRFILKLRKGLKNFLTNFGRVNG
ncbi:uncharacterized protein [Clytia hemisphaerica]|uniref:Uncharacterized protein n=1 Tax=Clytia hemisphaerica TaxID=252671 RepID=A0A7M5X4Z9_9CNID|eukprot:TCONS_00047540-protein